MLHKKKVIGKSTGFMMKIFKTKTVKMYFINYL